MALARLTSEPVIYLLFCQQDSDSQQLIHSKPRIHAVLFQALELSILQLGMHLRASEYAYNVRRRNSCAQPQSRLDRDDPVSAEIARPKLAPSAEHAGARRVWRDRDL